MAEIKTYNMMVGADTNYSEINDCIAKCLETGTMPYRFSKPLLPNMNLVTGRGAKMDITMDKIEFKARSIGAKETLWVYGADAAFLGLELKSTNPEEYKKAKTENKNFDCLPFTVMQNTKERLMDKKVAGNYVVSEEGLEVNAQAAYLIEQFTDSSVKRLFNSAKLRSLFEERHQSRELASKVSNICVQNYSRYKEGLEMKMDSDGRERMETKEEMERRRLAIKQNIMMNLNESHREGAQKVKSLPKDQVSIYEYRYKSHLNKFNSLNTFTSAQMDKYDQAFENEIKKAVEDPSKKGGITRALFNGFALAEKTTHVGMSFEPIFESQDAIGKLKAMSNMPKAMQKIEEKHILDERAKKKYQGKDFAMHVGFDRGM